MGGGIDEIGTVDKGRLATLMVFVITQCRHTSTTTTTAGFN